MLDAVTQARIWQVLLDYLDTHQAGLVLVTHSPTLQTRLATTTLTGSFSKPPAINLK
jgi:ABC-type dipeptide/oligopeptide/nickel transport system ATPase subunit